MKTILITTSLMLSSLALGSNSTFHVAFPIASKDGIQEFYGDLLGGKITEKNVNNTTTFSIEIDGHSIVMRVYPDFIYKRQWLENDVVLGDKTYTNVDAQHFGLIVSKERWLELSEKVLLLQKNGHDLIEIDPFIKNESTPNEVGFMILKAPSGYSFEVKFVTNSVHTDIQENKTNK